MHPLDHTLLSILDAGAPTKHDDEVRGRILTNVRQASTSETEAPRTPERVPRRGFRRRIALIALPAAAVIAVAGIALETQRPNGAVVLAAPSAEDLSSWQASPAPVTDPIAARDSCLSSYGADLGTSSDASFLLEERRGEFTSMIARYKGDTVFCIVNADNAGLLHSISDPNDDIDLTTQPTAGLTQAVSGGRLDGPEDERIHYATGRAADDVESIELILNDGRTVSASVEGGWWVAWWSGAATSDTAQLAWSTSGGPSQTQALSELPF